MDPDSRNTNDSKRAEMLELQFKNSPVATFILDRALKVLRINPAAAGMLTVSPDAAPGRHLRELLAVSETLASSLRKALSANQTVEIQEELLIRGRTRVQYRVTATPAKASQESFLQCFFVEQPLLQNDSAPLNDLDPEQPCIRKKKATAVLFHDVKTIAHAGGKHNRLHLQLQPNTIHGML